ncbi:uncharacterized protein LOC134848343 [Symsagittifera roscoffensis]|uniref:uncharacterized protein LOC134848343 n=1 Tax=Symsagittifera roscoffensis TaxID=84072 RepID=UPI00307C1231
MWYDYTTLQLTPREGGTIPDGDPSAAPEINYDEHEQNGDKQQTSQEESKQPRKHVSPVLLLSSDPDENRLTPTVPSWMARESSRTSVPDDEEADEVASKTNTIKGKPKLKIIRTPEGPVATNSGVELPKRKDDEDQTEKKAERGILYYIDVTREILWKVCFVRLCNRYINATLLEAFFLLVYLALIAANSIFVGLDFSPLTTGSVAIAGIAIWFSVIGIYSVLWLVAKVPYNSQSSARCNVIGGMGSMVLLVLHAAPLTCNWNSSEDTVEECKTGVAAAVLFGVSILTSFSLLRNWMYRFSNLLNFAFVVKFFVLCGYHKAYFIFIAFLFVLLDIICRVISTARNAYLMNKASLTRLPSNVIKIEMERPLNFTFEAGQHIRVYIPLVSKFEWHPFSISSSPFDPQLTLHVRVGGGRWGKNLYKVASGQDDHHSSSSKHKKVRLFFYGPFGKPTLDLWGDRKKYSVFISINAGIGVTPGQSICNTLLQQHREGERKVDKIYFVWSVKDSFNRVHRLPCEPELANPDIYQLPFSFQPDLLKRSLCDPKIVHASYHMTKTRIAHEFAEGNIFPGVQKGLCLSRLHMSAEFEHAFSFCKTQNVPRVAVILCAPKSFLREVEFLCREWSLKGVKFDLHVENFTV